MGGLADTVVEMTKKCLKEHEDDPEKRKKVLDYWQNIMLVGVNEDDILPKLQNVYDSLKTDDSGKNVEEWEELAIAPERLDDNDDYRSVGWKGAAVAATCPSEIADFS